jgi:hypothetical protein
VGHSTARPSCRPVEFDAGLDEFLEDLRGLLDIRVSVAALLDNSPPGVTAKATLQDNFAGQLCNATLQANLFRREGLL